MYFIRNLLLCLALLSNLLFCTACSDTGSVMAADDPGSSGQVQAGLGLDLPIDTVLPGETLDDRGCVIPSTCRTASIQHEEVAAQGSQVFAKIGMATQNGAALELNSGSAGQGNLAAGIYRLPVGENIPATLNVELSPGPRRDASSEYVGASGFYIGVGDYNRGTWDWNGPLTDSSITLLLEDVQVTQLGNAFVAVVAHDGAFGGVINVTTRSTRPDLIKPPQVTGLDAEPAGGGAHVSWTPEDFLNIAGYRVYASYQSFTPLNPNYAKSVVDYLLWPPFLNLPAPGHENWYYSVAAVDTAGNESEWSPVMSAVPASGEPFDFSIYIDPPSAVPGQERSIQYYSDQDLGNMYFNLDMDGDGVYETQQQPSPYSSLTTSEYGVSRVAIQACFEDDPSRMAVAKASVWTGRELLVGSGLEYSRIEDALAVASEGDTILVYPLDGGVPYEEPAVYVDKANIIFKGVYFPGESRVVLDGAGYDYSGVGSIPRAIFQFQPGADGCVVEGFELTGAHNTSYNGAGVRINQANHVTIRDCEIHDNDMGLMSNGNGTTDTAVNQVIEFCHVHHNGNEAHAGFNHNFYMGGTSVTVRGCEVNNSLTGHNIKSRARFNRVEWCYVHDSANREFDLVDAAGDTDYWGADSVIIGCLIVKDPACTGNRAVINFGQDIGNDHKGTLWVVNNTIVTPFISPVVNPSASSAGARLYNNLVWDTDNGQTGQQLITLSGDAQAAAVQGSDNWLPYGMEIIDGTGIDLEAIHMAANGENPPFSGGTAPDITDNGWQLGSTDPNIMDAGTAFVDLSLPAGTGQEPGDVLYAYRDYLWLAERPEDTMTTLGAFTAAF